MPKRKRDFDLATTKHGDVVEIRTSSGTKWHLAITKRTSSDKYITSEVFVSRETASGKRSTRHSHNASVLRRLEAGQSTRIFLVAKPDVTSPVTEIYVNGIKVVG